LLLISQKLLASLREQFISSTQRAFLHCHGLTELDVLQHQALHGRALSNVAFPKLNGDMAELLLVVTVLEDATLRVQEKLTLRTVFKRTHPSHVLSTVQ
jgi:hypothetical protein